MISGNLPLHGVDRLLVAVQELSMARTLEQVVEIVRHAARDLCGADGATFILREDGECYYVDEDAIAPLWSGMRFPLETCISGWAMLHRQPAAIRDIYADPRIPHDAYRPTFVRSLAMVPIRSVDPIGAIGNYWADQHEPTDAEVRLLQALADSASVAMENVAIFAELTAAKVRATTDELTGLLNRRGFSLSAQATIDAARSANLEAVMTYATSTGSRRSTTGTGTRPATPISGRPPTCSPGCPGRASWSRGWVGTSSARSRSTRRSRVRRSRSGSSRS